MDELVGPNIQVVLGIKEGRNFDKITQPTMLVASLNNHVLETDKIEADPSPQFDTDLVWEADKNALRKMRSGQTPLKLECFAIKENGSKEKIGYILLSIRCAQIVPKHKENCRKMDSHRLLGLRNDLKANKPELLLSFTIEDRDINNPNFKETQGLKTSAKSNTIIPFFSHEERLIQLGPPCEESFLFNVTASHTRNLDSLLPENLIKDSPVHLNFWYHMMDNDIQLNSFTNDFENTRLLNEKVIMRIKTPLTTLKNYLNEKPNLKIYLKCQDLVLGQSEVDLRPLLSIDNLESSLKSNMTTSAILEQRCYLTKNGMNSVVKNEDTTPYLHVLLKLHHMGTESKELIPNSSFPIVPPNHPNSRPQKNETLNEMKTTDLKSHKNHNDDFKTCQSESNCSVTHTNDQLTTNEQCASSRISKSQPTIIAHSRSTDLMLHSGDGIKVSKTRDTYHCYCLNTSVNEISLNHNVQNIEFRFHHPKVDISVAHAKVAVSSITSVKLQNIECKFHFISTPRELDRLLLSFPPKMSICDANRSKMCLSEITFNMKPLIQHKYDCKYELPLRDIDQNSIGTLNVALILKDYGIYQNNKQTPGENLGPPIMDDNLIYNIMNEFDMWKEQQIEIFKFELRKKEEHHLNLLNDEWQKRKSNLETKLAGSIEQCKVLTNCLNNATEDLRMRRLKGLEKEAKLIKMNDELQVKYETKLKELRETHRVVIEDLSSKMKIIDQKNAYLESQIKELILENEKLRSTIYKQKEELELNKEGSLTTNQTASLLKDLKSLEEELGRAHKSKFFYKEQWAQTLRDMHKLKEDNQHTIEFQIQNSREELENLDLEEILHADSEALTHDQMLLGQIQKEIDTIKPETNSEINSNERRSKTPITNVCNFKLPTLNSTRSIPFGKMG